MSKNYFKQKKKNYTRAYCIKRVVKDLIYFIIIKGSTDNLPVK